KFNLTPYLAITVQSLNDIMTITNGSNIIALRERGACDPARGFLYYVLSNPDWFTTTDELMEKVQRLVSDKGWTANYSRSLVVNPILGRSGGNSYGDHTGVAFHETWKAKIENRRPDAAAVGAVCILDA